MKRIKLFEQFTSENIDNDNKEEFNEDGIYHQTPKYLDSIDQISVEKGLYTYFRYLETEDFIYFVPKDTTDEEVIMYRKSDLSLASDNYFANESLFEDVEDGNYTWLSDIAKKDIELFKQQQSEE